MKNNNPQLVKLVGTEGTVHSSLTFFGKRLVLWVPDHPELIIQEGKRKEPRITSPTYHLEPIVDRPELSSWEECGFHPDDFIQEASPCPKKKAPQLGW